MQVKASQSDADAGQNSRFSSQVQRVMKDRIVLEITIIKITTTTTTKCTLEIVAKAIQRKNSNQRQLSEPK